MKPYLIGLDWGTSSFRAYLIDEDHLVAEEISNSKGIVNTGTMSFEEVLKSSIGHWLLNYPDTPLLASGMIGSRQGWHEVPYLNCPVSLSDLADHLESVPMTCSRNLWLVPGIMMHQSDSAPEVMRGEETQILGAIGESMASCCFILPGTHSKWAIVESGSINWFSTFMTGEMFNLLCNHSILGKSMANDHVEDEASFGLGLEYAMQTDERSGGLLKKLFSVRTLYLFDKLAATGIKSYLSGLLIGTELQNALVNIDNKSNIQVIGESNLSKLYANALKRFGYEATMAQPDVVITGLILLAEQSNIINR